MKSSESVRKAIQHEPSDFFVFLDAVNAYRGYESFLRDYKEVLEEKKSTFPDDLDTARFHALKQLECTPFKKYILYGKKIDIRDLLRFIRTVRRYEIFYELRGLFIEIMKEIEDLREKSDFPPKEDYFFSTGRFPAFMFITTDGYYDEDLPTKIFQNVDFSRIKTCICGNYFWASRRDKNCCSPECGNRARQRKFLEDENKRKEYNEKRLQYYHENKEAIKERNKRKIRR